MPSRYRRVVRGNQFADDVLHKLGYELREARLAAGLSLRDTERGSGISRAQISRLERGAAPRASLRDLTVLFAVLGQRLSARPYPEGPPLRDIAHARLLARFKAGLPASIGFRTEVPIRREGDRRAWDGELRAGDDRCQLEAETVLRDLQATDRRVSLKMTDDGVDRVILLVADTRRHRRVLREFRGLVEARYPADTREVMKALRRGVLPRRSGVVLR
jgi:transcriptional regulator with XRE-family HTH domain